MNLILFNRSERKNNQLVIGGRRAAHILKVIRARCGDRLRVGEEGGGQGSATVIAIGEQTVTLKLSEKLSESTMCMQTPLAMTTLTIALPRPKVVLRTISTAASFGVGSIEVINAWRVDKSYFSSPRLQPDALRHAAILGCEQGGHTHIPQISIHPRFLGWLNQFDLDPAERRMVLHPRAPRHLGAATRVQAHRKTRIAIGPERGWIDRELESLGDRGFVPVCLSSSVLRVETAVTAALAQFELLSMFVESNEIAG